VTDVEENLNVGGIYSKFWRITLVIVSVLLIFAGPTYVPYIMSKVHIDFYASFGAGVLLFIVGIAMMLFLAGKKIIS